MPVELAVVPLGAIMQCPWGSLVRWRATSHVTKQSKAKQSKANVPVVGSLVPLDAIMQCPWGSLVRWRATSHVTKQSKANVPVVCYVSAVSYDLALPGMLSFQLLAPLFP